jgi:hypothetical protein
MEAIREPSLRDSSSTLCLAPTTLLKSSLGLVSPSLLKLSPVSTLLPTSLSCYHFLSSLHFSFALILILLHPFLSLPHVLSSSLLTFPPLLPFIVLPSNPLPFLNQAWLFALVGAGQMCVWAKGKHIRYLKEFNGENGTERYPRSRKILVPFIY